MSDSKELEGSFEESKHNESSGSNNNNSQGDDICRDFLRNVCRRSNCRFRHPEGFEAEELVRKDLYIFCHDHQNRECRRNNCRFVHASKEEEAFYRKTGRLPQHILDRTSAGETGNRANGATSPPGYGTRRGSFNEGPYGSTGGDPNISICKDFLKGECRRGPGRCKFRHVKPGMMSEAEDMRRHNGYSPGPYGPPPGHPFPGYQPPPSYGPIHHPMHPVPPPSAPVYHYPCHHHPPSNGNGYPPHPLHSYPPPPHAAHSYPPAIPSYPPPRPAARGFYDPSSSYGPSEAKRRAFEGHGDRPISGKGVGIRNDNDSSPESGSKQMRETNSSAQNNNDSDDCLPALSSSSSNLNSKNNGVAMRYLEEENSALRRRVEDLKNQVADLMTRNEFLLDQNAQLRASVAATGAVVAAAGGFQAGISKGINVQVGVPSSAAATAAASVAAASTAAQQAVASAVAAAAAAGAGAAGLAGQTNTSTVSVPTVPVPTSVTVELPVSSLPAALAGPVFSAASGVPCVSSIASLLNSTTTMTPVMSHVSTQPANSSVATHYVSYPIISSPCVTATHHPNSHQMH